MEKEEIKKQLDDTISMIEILNEKRNKLDDLYMNWEKFTTEYKTQVSNDLGLVEETLNVQIDKIIEERPEPIIEPVVKEIQEIIKEVITE
jgi:hypothetical protein